jgi:ring-1,2-phenylacetyl-CoA epoxidase subunit PaaE
MTPRLHQLKVARIEPLTADAKAIYLEIPAHLKDAFKYIPGQYLTFEIELNGHRQRRAYSICTSPYSETHPAIGVKKVANGAVSVYMNEKVNEGDTLLVMEPLGSFTHQPDAANKHHYVLLGGGSGITPLMAILKSVLEIEAESRITLIYANRNESSVMFKPLLEQLQSKYSSRFNIIYNVDEGNAMTDNYSGMLNKNILSEMLRTHLSAEINTVDYFICGPSGMMLMIDETLAELGVTREKIHREYFTTPAKTEPAEVAAASDTPLDEAELFITLDGSNIETKYSGQKSILEAALDEGYDPPFACQIGACCTCRAKLKEGKVVMADRESLSDAEIKEGYILTCQSKPLTSRLVYTYDE